MVIRTDDGESCSLPETSGSAIAKLERKQMIYKLRLVNIPFSSIEDKVFGDLVEAKKLQKILDLIQLLKVFLQMECCHIC